MKNDQRIPFVLALDEATATLEHVGGKGASLARMAAAGFPVPPGFHVTTEAYRRFVTENALQEKILAAVAADDSASFEFEAASRQIGGLFANGVMPNDIATAIRQAYAELGGSDLPVAVRSSATAEDLPDMSFAGQQESYLNMRGDAMVLDAVKRCWASLWTARAIGYRTRHGIAPQDVSLAAVVQKLVPGDAAGILFTANPVTGARDQVVINAAWGLGEAVVGGQVTPDTFVVDKNSGRIVQQQISEKTVMTVRTPEGTREEPVAADRRTLASLTPEQAAELTRIGVQIDEFYDRPMDIEWVLHDGYVYIVQARPITTLRGDTPATEEWNDSLKGDFLWTNTNLGEAVPDVMTPCTWSFLQIFLSEAMAQMYVNGYEPVGNIGGRCYMNQSVPFTLAAKISVGRKRYMDLIEDIHGRIPDDLEMPQLPLSRWRLLLDLLPAVVRFRRRVAANWRRLPEFIAVAPARSEALHAQIQAASSAADLINLWQVDLGPFFRECSRMLEAAAKGGGNALVAGLRRDLSKLVGDADANTLLSASGADSGNLASLGPVLGLTQLIRGEIDRAAFARQYGHRSPHEFEVSTPRPAEDPDWIDRQLAGLRAAPADVGTLLARQQEAYAAAWERLRQRHPGKAASIQRRLEQNVTTIRNREATRSEVIRVFRVLRALVLRAGALTGQGDALFFLSFDEILAVLGGDSAPLARVPARRATHAAYSALPPYPSLIRGRFDPFEWAADPQRRSDVFDATRSSIAASDAVTGFPGSAGVVEGVVRVIASPEEGDQLQAGEILVTTVTNIGWTPLFPRAAAVVTDVGAPLSHAAIVARELGIPAVVGCGNATMRLRTGDRVRVNGGQGMVEVLHAPKHMAGRDSGNPDSV